MSSAIKTAYEVTAEDGAAADQIAERIALEQSAELPKQSAMNQPHSVPLGEVQSVRQLSGNRHRIEILFPAELFGDDRLQLINVLFGNVSLLPGIRLVDVDWNAVGQLFPGPGFGIDGVREEMQIFNRPLSCAALKPIGLTANELADLFYQFGGGGFDLIKDDHGLTNQPSAPFAERLESCRIAAERVQQEGGRPVAYVPNVTGSPDEVRYRLELCRKADLRFVMLSPHLSGFESLTWPQEYGLGALAHPAFSGSMVIQAESGIEPRLLYGEIWRAFGADGVIYPNAGGRFVLDNQDCQALNQAVRNPELPWKPGWPVPGGGIQRDTIGDWISRYGNDTIFLIGGSLYEAPEGLEQASASFTQTLQEKGTS